MSATKPNVIVIYLDDLGYGDLGCYGSDAILTPHIDALADSGVRFTNWYSCSPVCSPSRAALLTGRAPMRAGVPHILGGQRGLPGLPPSETTLASMLKQSGYRTALTGKWHLGMSEEHSPNAHGFDSFLGFKAGCVDYYSHIFYWSMASGHDPVHDLWRDRSEVWRNGQYMTEVITDEVVRSIEDGGDDPFCHVVGYNAPHYPMHAPEKYLDRYPSLPPDRRIMAAMVSAVDDGVGRIVASLKSQGLYDDTIIFFSSDNGPSTESRNWLDGNVDFYYGGSAGVFRGHKGSLFEGGIREPAILSWPAGIEGGRVSDEVCAMWDVVPTICEIAGADMPGDRTIDGRSIVPLLSDGAPSPHERLCWEYAGQLAVREGPWKLVLDGKLDFTRGQPDAVHLSNLDDDPGERTNLADAQPELVERLSKRVRAWFADVTDGGGA